MQIFAVVLEICVNFPYVYLCLCPYIIKVSYAVVVYKITTSMVITPRCQEGCWSIDDTSGDVGSGVADCDKMF